MFLTKDTYIFTYNFYVYKNFSYQIELEIKIILVILF